jgi:hypothetical protein
MYFLSSDDTDADASTDTVSMSVAVSSHGAFAAVRWELP